MALKAEALKNVKLRTTTIEQKQDRSAPNYALALGGEVTPEKEEERRQYFFSTGLDRWYASLKDKTFRTEFLNIEPDEAKVIVKHWQTYFKNRTSDDGDPDEFITTVPSTLKGLCDRIDTLIATMATGNGVFVKLSTRSPKDSHIAFAKARKIYSERYPSQCSTSPIPNNKLILLQESVIESLKVNNGAEAVQLFMSSTRVGEDLEYALEPGDEGFSERSCMVIRQWVNIPLWAEFRGFVWNGKLTSIGQYNHPVVFPQLLGGNIQQIQSDLENFFDSLKSQIPIDRYIIDFAWTPDKVYLVEVNPFDGEIVFPASTGLWSWDNDRHQMMNGPMELRIRTIEQDPHLLKTGIDPVWRAVLFQ